VSSQGISSAPKNTEILWDIYGIPHIYGNNAQGALLFTFVVDPGRVADITDTKSAPGSNGWAIAPDLPHSLPS
jgi:hypothetical protein